MYQPFEHYQADDYIMVGSKYLDTITKKGAPEKDNPCLAYTKSWHVPEILRHATNDNNKGAASARPAVAPRHYMVLQCIKRFYKAVWGLTRPYHIR